MRCFCQARFRDKRSKKKSSKFVVYLKKIIFAKNIIIMKQEFTETLSLAKGLVKILKEMGCCC
ncbi:hypothetical protein OC25_16785 [Pedobacter kyungheensis]|uniref:Uncharacterized protein n=1 Tax=Pedobacter kyungheensis TaxID=1069985 RepID=A0A0C1FKI9_9SPHI|nr:hypothetical protein OC25_16785 [Pedobacter kyungheensis]